MKHFMVLLVLAASVLSAQDYVGSKKCKSCHNKEAKGAQYKVWEASKHASAFETLKSDAAAKIATAKGLDVPAYEAPECVQCHVVGFGKGGFEIKGEEFWSQVTEKGKPIKAVKLMETLKGVGCEVCHGAGSKYKSSKTMKGITAGTIDPVSVGFMNATEETCRECHNEKSPGFKEFNFEEMFKEVAHPAPK